MGDYLSTFFLGWPILWPCAVSFREGSCLKTNEFWPRLLQTWKLFCWNSEFGGCFIFGWWLKGPYCWWFRNPANQRVLYTQVVQEFFHQQYHSKESSTLRNHLTKLVLLLGMVVFDLKIPLAKLIVSGFKNMGVLMRHLRGLPPSSLVIWLLVVLQWKVIHLNERFHRHSSSICQISLGKYYENIGFLLYFATLLFMVLSPNYHDCFFSCDFKIYQLTQNRKEKHLFVFDSLRLPEYHVFQKSWIYCTLPKTNLAPENGPGPKRKRESLPTIHCQMLPLMETSCTTWRVWNPVNTTIFTRSTGKRRISEPNKKYVSGRIWGFPKMVVPPFHTPSADHL